MLYNPIKLVLKQNNSVQPATFTHIILISRQHLEWKLRRFFNSKPELVSVLLKQPS